jgi:hypothetical protein
MNTVPGIAVLTVSVMLNPLDAARPHVVVVTTDDPHARIMNFSFPSRSEAEAQADRFRRGTLTRDPPNTGA